MDKKPIYSLWAFGLLTAIYIFFFFNNREWKKSDALRYDMMSYYSYLPAVFIEKDITLNSDSARHNNFYSWSVEAPARDGRIIRMSAGVAYLELPFFLLAHISAPLLGHPTDGFNPHYFFFILVGSLFYTLAGVWLLRKLLLLYFDDKVVAITIALVAGGTNLLYYTIYEGGMSHAYNFFLVTALLWLTVKWYNTPTLKTTILLGVVAGIITLARPTNILVVLLPVLYGLQSKQTFIQKLELIKTRWYFVVIAAICAFLMLLPQFMYWHYLSGKFMFYTYGDEKLNFANPHIFYGLFSYRKGWYVYTPVMFVATLGLFFVWSKLKEWRLALLLFFPFYVWAIYSWWTWWYGGSFGSRPMIDIYGVMALPLAAIAQWALQRKLSGATFLAVGAFLIYLNGFQIWQYKKTLIHWDSMTKQAYWKVFLSTKYPENYGDLQQTPDYEKAIKGEEEY
jgi:hypothetical protein